MPQDTDVGVKPTCGMVLLQAAGAIHGDFERGFICAEVMKYDELHDLGNENAVKVGSTTPPSHHDG